MQSVSVFLDIRKVAHFRWESTDISRAQGLRHVISILFRSPLGKV